MDEVVKWAVWLAFGLFGLVWMYVLTAWINNAVNGNTARQERERAHHLAAIAWYGNEDQMLAQRHDLAAVEWYDRHNGWESGEAVH